jgi:hypothetical protein
MADRGTGTRPARVREGICVGVCALCVQMTGDIGGLGWGEGLCACGVLRCAVWASGVVMRGGV